MGKNDDVVTDPGQIEAALADSETPAAPARCDCPALDVPHVHEPSGPVALPEDAR